MRAAALALLLAIWTAGPLAAQGATVLRPLDAETDLNFGAAVALDGTTLLVGAPGDSAGVPGRAYVFRFTPTGWIEEAKLEVPGAAGLGKSVAVAGNVALVGAPEYVNSGGTASGGVFVFERTGTTWGAPTLLLPSDAATTQRFGQDVDVELARLLVAGAERAYVFEPRGGAWTESATLAYGSSTVSQADLSGNRALLAFGPSQGHGVVFEYSGSSWDSGLLLDDTGVPIGSFLPQGAAIDGERAVVMTQPFPCQFGQMHGYRLTPSEWKKDMLVGGMFGTAAHTVELDGERLAVGGGKWLTIYRALPSGGWFEGQALAADVPEVLGPRASADLSGNLGVLGTSWDDTGGDDSGSVSVWELAALTGLPLSLSVDTGGTQQLELRRGPFEAFSLYWIFGSATGTMPGLSVDGLPLPLNFDAYYLFLLLNPNTVVQPTLGLLDGQGYAAPKITFGGFDPALLGLTLNHVALTFDLSSTPFVDFVSQAVPLRLVQGTTLPDEDFESGDLDWETAPATFGVTDWKIVEDGACGAVTRMLAYTTAAPACGAELPGGFGKISNARVSSPPFRLDVVADYELHLDSILSPGLEGRIRLFVDGPTDAYFEIAWPHHFADTGALESLAFSVPGIEFALGNDAQIEFLLNGVPSGTPAGWWIDNVELVER